jgi:uncharacterized protein (TIGR04551 family)
MSAHALLAVLAFAPALALAQPAPQAPPEQAAPAAQQPAPAGSGSEEISREVERRVEAAKKDLREEIRAQIATQSVAQGWNEEWVEEKRKLELFVVDGYFRVRPDLFYKFDLNRAPDPGGHTLWPISPLSAREKTVAGANMRFRFEPTLNVSEEVRVRLQIDALDNLVMGTTPEYAFSRSERADYSVLTETQNPPTSGINAFRDSIAVKRAYGEVATPIGVIRFGRMGSQFGLGILHNDGNCLDCDHGDTVDRIQFVTEPLPGIFLTPMLDFNVEGPTSARALEGGQPWDLSQGDDAHSYVLAIARRDTDQQVRAKLESNQAVLNWGVHVTYRTQRNDPADFLGAPFTTEGGGATNLGYLARGATLWMPDVWARYEQKDFRLELEVASIFGTIGHVNRTNGAVTDLQVLQFGAVAQGEYRLMGGRLRLQGEVGYASGDPRPGMGNLPSRLGSGPDGLTAPGDIEGPQHACRTTGGCDEDKDIRNFRFDRDYRVDLILWREILGRITDAIYVKPSAEYEVADGLYLFGSAIYSRAVFLSSTPAAGTAAADPSLGIEFDGGARYQTEDGFFASVQAGILFPLGGLGQPQQFSAVELEAATAFRGSLGVKF